MAACSWPALGLEVFATASRGKWDTLRAMGFDESHIGDRGRWSLRTSSGGHRGRAWTWCSTRCREFVDASLRLVAPGGIFLEMGKTDIRDPNAVANSTPACATAPSTYSSGRRRIQRISPTWPRCSPLGSCTRCR
ncbi:phenolphthiocerol synthesis polyketide synthase type I Pks15/1 domain protein [Mycobacterium xenopi 4042]|uniref:Phenolphthiocerol synthesis polyketide synthase type I Pks15/1 domain protein n=1 Tax=Mycobacterium xenopi 4042 TaxID=1299334 RepID=X7YYY2_MYCXE|nr:phenolphthiocerol synthesis polyketide synthase type I Pks15/1 domain protein [Mycobacterium xenopi 4042]